MINEDIEDLVEQPLPVAQTGSVYALMMNDLIIEVFVYGNRDQARRRLRDLREQNWREYKKTYVYDTRETYENRFIWHMDHIKATQPC